MIAGLDTFSPSVDGLASGYQRWKNAAKQMVDRLPEEGATIIVMTNAIGKTLKKGIAELRGKKLSRRCRMISVQHQSDVDKLLGLRGRIEIDTSFTEHASPEVVSLIERAVAGIRAIELP